MSSASQTDPEHPEHPAHPTTGGLGRRGFLGVTAAGVVAAASAPAPAVAAPPRHERPPGEARVTTMAMVTDVHINLDDDSASRRFAATIQAIEAEKPELVINCGDTADSGARSEMVEYLSILPASLRDKTHQVPGNHETKWDWSAYETFVELLGPTSHVVTVDGLQIIFLNTSNIQQGPAYITDEGLAWLRRELERGGRNRPTLIVTHHPLVGEDFYLMPREDALMDVIAPYQVRGILCGHVHQQILRRCNGLTLMAGKDNKRRSGFYRLVRTRTARSDLLDITYVAVADPTAPDTPVGETRVTTIDLGARLGPGEAVRTVYTRARVVEDHVRVSTVVPHRAQVAATIYNPFEFNGRDSDVWTELSQQGSVYAGDLPLTGLPAGEYRVIVRVTDENGDQWREITPFDNPGPALAPRWTAEVGGAIHGAVVEHEGLVVAAGSTGAVAAFRPHGPRSGRRWSRRTGPVYSDPAFAPDGSLVYLPSTDHTVTALRASDGRQAWRSRLGAPVVTRLLAAEVDGSPRVVAAAGHELWCLDGATGHVVWHQPLAELSAGRPASNGQDVFFGCGDGNAWCVSGADGSEVWRTDLSDGHTGVQDGPWITNVLLPGQLAIFSTRNRTVGLDQATGEQVWSLKGKFLFCPPAIAEDSLVLVDAGGMVKRVDAATGTVRWTAETAGSTDNPGVLVQGDRALVTSSAGMVFSVDLADGSVELLRHTSNAMVISTPALTDGGDTLVVAGQDGVLRGFSAVSG